MSDSFALRLAYQHQEWDGMWTEVNSGEDMYTESDVVRVSARWDMTDNLEALIKFNYGKAKTNYTSAINIPTNLAQPGVEYPDRFAINQPNSEQNEDDGFGLRLTWAINESLTLVSITDARHGENDYFEDVDGTADDLAIDMALLGGAVGGHLEQDLAVPDVVVLVWYLAEVLDEVDGLLGGVEEDGELVVEVPADDLRRAPGRSWGCRRR